MRTIQKYLPNPRNTEVHRVYVHAKPSEAWETVRHFDMGKIPWVRFLFDIRTLPDKITGKHHKEDKGLGVDHITEDGSGFQILEEVAGREVVVGSIGKFWRPAILFAEFTPLSFTDFQTPGYGKLAWSISVAPYQEGSTISIEVRTTATDQLSWEKFNRYFHIIGIGSRLIRSSLMKHMETVLGKYKRPEEDTRPLPGDERLLYCRYQLTHSIDIEAPPSLVWRYLMQLGCDRGGWYSIDALDHGGVPSVDHLVDGWETREAGDKLIAAPKGQEYFMVYGIEKEKHFILSGDYAIMNKPYKTSWAFILEPIGNDATHLITRARMELEPPLLEWIWGNMVAYPAHAIMQKAQLKNLKRICERDAQLRTAEKMVYERT